MTLSDSDAQTLIVRKVGDIDPVTGDPLDYGTTPIAGVVGANIALLWSSHSDKAQITPRLRELYVERDAFDLVLGALGALVDYSLEGESVRLSQRVAGIAQRRYRTNVEIEALQKVALNRRAPAVGPILTTAPVSPPTTLTINPYGPDANDPSYTGSPYAPRRDVRT